MKKNILNHETLQTDFESLFRSSETGVQCSSESVLKTTTNTPLKLKCLKVELNGKNKHSSIYAWFLNERTHA